jgi:hypothetical protein
MIWPCACLAGVAGASGPRRISERVTGLPALLLRLTVATCLAILALVDLSISAASQMTGGRRGDGGPAVTTGASCHPRALFRGRLSTNASTNGLTLATKFLIRSGSIRAVCSCRKVQLFFLQTPMAVNSRHWPGISTISMALTLDPRMTPWMVAWSSMFLISLRRSRTSCGTE